MHSLNITASSPVNSAVVNFACYILDPNYGKGRLENTFFHFFFLLFRSTCNWLHPEGFTHLGIVPTWIRKYNFGNQQFILRASVGPVTVLAESLQTRHVFIL